MGFALIGTVAPGGGYTAAGRSLDDLAEAGKLADKGGELTRAGRSLEKHGSRSGSVFPRATGNASEKNAQGQAMLEDILTHPGSVVVPKSGKHFGGVEIWKPNGQGALFDAKGAFVGFREPNR